MRILVYKLIKISKNYIEKICSLTYLITILSKAIFKRINKIIFYRLIMKDINGLERKCKNKML
jgi:hypothetical protein